FSVWGLLRMILNHFPQGALPCLVAKHMGIALPTVSKRLYELEEKGYILRKASETDRRVTYIYVTDPGKAVVDDNYRLFIDKFHQATVELSEEKTLQMYNLLEEFRVCLENQLENQGGKDI
ncbi:MAG: MarR family transcriptional regulator, partial [Oscillospiraceae bacterium]